MRIISTFLSYIVLSNGLSTVTWGWGFSIIFISRSENHKYLNNRIGILFVIRCCFSLGLAYLDSCRDFCCLCVVSLIFLFVTVDTFVTWSIAPYRTPMKITEELYFAKNSKRNWKFLYNSKFGASGTPESVTILKIFLLNRFYGPQKNTQIDILQYSGFSCENKNGILCYFVQH